MSLIGLIVDFAIALGLLGGKNPDGGPRFELAYVSGHPDFHQPHDKGGLTIAPDRLKYSKGWGDEVTFEIPFDLIVSARAADPDGLIMHLRGQDGSSSEIYFRGMKRKEVNRFLAALSERSSRAVPAD
jgi:hypothetical protein